MRIATGQTTDSIMLFTLYVVTKCLQHALIFTAVLFYLQVISALWKKKVYHSNLLVLLTALPVPSLIGVSTSLVMDVVGAFDLLVSPVENTIVFINKIGMFGGSLNLPNFIVERIAATILVDKYEHCNKSFPFLSCAMLVMQVAIVVFLVYLNAIDVISNSAGTVIFAIICVVSVVLFCILPFVSRRAYALHLRRHSGVSARYQSAENVRAARLLNKLMALYAFFFFAENSYFYVIMFILEYQDLSVFELLLALLNIFVTLEVFVTVAVIGLSHPSLKLGMFCLSKQTTCKGRYRRTCPSAAKPVAANSGVRALDGRQLLFTNEEEKEMYFQNYAQMWNK